MIFTTDDKGNIPSDAFPEPPSTSKVNTYFRSMPAPLAHSRHRTPKRRYSIKDRRQEMTLNALRPQRALPPTATPSNSTTASSRRRNFTSFETDRAESDSGDIMNDKMPFVLFSVFFLFHSKPTLNFGATQLIHALLKPMEEHTEDARVEEDAARLPVRPSSFHISYLLKSYKPSSYSCYPRPGTNSCTCQHVGQLCALCSTTSVHL